MNKSTLALILAGVLTIPALAMSETQDEFADESNSKRFDQDAMSYVETNMLWANNCQYRLNMATSRPHLQDGELTQEALNEWMEALDTLCDHTFGFATCDGANKYGTTGS